MMSDRLRRMHARLAQCKAAGEPDCWDIQVTKADLRKLLELAEEPKVVVFQRADDVLHRALHSLDRWDVV